MSAPNQAASTNQAIVFALSPVILGVLIMTSLDVGRIEKRQEEFAIRSAATAARMVTIYECQDKHRGADNLARDAGIYSDIYDCDADNPPPAFYNDAQLNFHLMEKRK